MNEQEQFLKESEGSSLDILEQPLEPEKPEGQQEEGEQQEENKEDDEQKLRNRRERRLAAKLQAERESSIQLAARLEAITDAERTRTSEAADYLKSVERIYGTSTPEATEATRLLQSALKDLKEEAKREALEAYQEERQKEVAAEREADSELEDMLEELEDEHNIDLTSPAAENIQKGFFRLLEKMSPKDSEGNIVAYADPHAVWEMYQSSSRRTDNRAKDLAARSMVRSGASGESKLQDDSTVRFLKANGII